ncbi:MAG: hypothetical protein U0075_08675 [Thermomicrobiales bacterium]
MLISRMLSLALILILALPTSIETRPTDLQSFPAAPEAQAASQTPTPGASGQAPEPLRAGKRKARARHARDARSGSRKERKSRSASSSGSEATAITSEAAGDTNCGPGLIPLGDTGRCTHGPDPEPPGVSRALVRGVPSTSEVRQETANIACMGDGQSGYRVQVIYAYDKTQTNRLSQVIGNIRITAAGADDLMRQSSLAAGQELHFLFVHDAQCNISVEPVAFSSAAMQNFGTMIQTMYDGAQDRTDRIYLIFADTSTAGICGIGTMVKDDRDTPANRNNSGPGYSRVDRDCWAPQAATHELMHNLGGVQYTAPHSSGGSHCIDEWDVMCYSDSPNYPAMKYLCPDKSASQNDIDCNNDDYFDPLPQPGSYLDTHWNTADSVFLVSGPATCPTTAQGCLGRINLSASQSSIKSKKRLKLSASVSDATARNAIVTLRACRGSSCSWGSGQTIATLPGSAPSTQWKATGKGNVTFLAQVSTAGGVVTSNPVTVNVKKGKKKH